jgi:thiol-disulfide isomerase/thioredoxin
MALATWFLIGLVLLIVVILLIVKLTRGSTTLPPRPVTPAPGAVVHDATSIPATVFAAVAAPGPPVLQGPVVLKGQPVLRLDGKPAVVYIGAEFCPYCAAERWALVVALSRFGTFNDLGATTSSAEQVFASVPTFTFDGAHYSSAAVTFSAVEEYGAVPSTTAPAGYPRLHRPTALQAQLQRRFAGVGSANDPAALPFIDVADQALVTGSGVGFSPAVLQGLSMGQIAGDLSDPTNPVTQAVVGSANEIVATICSATGGRPASVCSSPGTVAGAQRLGLG